LDYVSTGDGQGTTLMVTENLNAGPWNGSFATGPNPGAATGLDIGVNNFGFGISVPMSGHQPTTGVFGTATGYLNTETGTFSTAVPDSCFINRYLNLANAGQGIAPRPSSQHAGGVNVMYCDGHGGFLSENVDKQVYAKLCTSNGGSYGEYTLNTQGY
jgi:prepilin-type processing-associated H-X9-DG protein